jgi:hypothetical protein
MGGLSSYAAVQPGGGGPGSAGGLVLANPPSPFRVPPLVREGRRISHIRISHIRISHIRISPIRTRAFLPLLAPASPSAPASWLPYLLPSPQRSAYQKGPRAAHTLLPPPTLLAPP